MRVLVTRPEPAASRTAEKLRAMGHIPVLLPLATAAPQVDAAIAALGRPHAAIALTSARAADVLAEIAHRLAPHLQTPVFAVGAATAQAIRALGFERITIGPGDGAGLARTIAGCWPPPHRQPLLYLAGSPRSPSFEQVLAQQHVAVLTVECYRMYPCEDVAALAAMLAGPAAPAAVLLYSAEGARQMRRMLEAVPPSLWPAAAFCLSPAVAMAFGDFHGSVQIASRPDEAGLLALLARGP